MIGALRRHETIEISSFQCYKGPFIQVIFSKKDKNKRNRYVSGPFKETRIRRRKEIKQLRKRKVNCM